VPVTKRSPGFRSEVELYEPVKSLLETQGYAVKGEVKGCDLVAVRGDEPPVIIELKLRFTLGLVLQGIDRLAMTDTVYLAIPAGVLPRERGIRQLCRRVGLGLVIVHPGRRGGRAEVVLDPLPYSPRKNARRAARLLGEHARRHGDHNRGGGTRVPVVTAYRQEALRIAALLARDGAVSVAALRRSADAPNAARILQRNVYGWFERVRRGTYALTESGGRALTTFSHAVPADLTPLDPPSGVSTAVR
jgi:hypothetical protein